ncbi:hypothetical protein F5Y04DRAFT_279792 [Hypomontagnella monticulosa]|nr:hypothetical protein F5Y04DRAFT_279792 [Hypomontagnella monticulosa]
MATGQNSAPEPEFPQYSRLPAEMKDEIWGQALLRRGMQYFVIDGQRLGEMNMSMFNCYIRPLAKSQDTSAWRRQNIVSALDSSARGVVKRQRQEAGSKKMFPVYPVRSSPRLPASIAYVNCDRDVICFKIQGRIVPIWERPVPVARLNGIKRVAIEYAPQPVGKGFVSPSTSFCCTPEAHRRAPLCGKLMALFLSNFPDLEEFYILYVPKRNDTQCVVKKKGAGAKAGGVKGKRAMDRELERFHDIAREKNLAIFEDTKFKYIEIVKRDVNKNLGSWDGMWRALREVRLNWEHYQKPAFFKRYAYKSPNIKLGIVVRAKI